MYFKIINRKLVYDFLLVVYSNFCRITHRSWEIWRETVQWTWNIAKVIDSRITCKNYHFSCSQHTCFRLLVGGTIITRTNRSTIVRFRFSFNCHTNLLTLVKPLSNALWVEAVWVWSFVFALIKLHFLPYVENEEEQYFMYLASWYGSKLQ